MKRSSALFVQLAIVMIGFGTLAFLLWEPHVEDRNAHATLFEIYFRDAFLAYAYIGSIPFFVAVFRAFQVAGYTGRNQIRSPAAVSALRTIKLCAIALIGFVAVGELYIMVSESDDTAGGIAMGIVIILASILVATAAAVLERILQNAMDTKPENDLLV